MEHDIIFYVSRDNLMSHRRNRLHTKAIREVSSKDKMVEEKGALSPKLKYDEKKVSRM